MADRAYTVLEEVTLPQLLERLGIHADLTDQMQLPGTQELDELKLYVKVATPVARNAEHALRVTMKEAFTPGDQPTLVPCSRFVPASPRGDFRVTV